jgi:hypothetical protein
MLLSQRENKFYSHLSAYLIQLLSHNAPVIYQINITLISGYLETLRRNELLFIQHKQRHRLIIRTQPGKSQIWIFFFQRQR